MWMKFFVLFMVLGIVLSNPTYSGSPAAMECVDGKSYNDGCNWCRCLGGRTACTLKACMIYDSVTGTYKDAPLLPPPDDYWVSTSGN